MMKRDLQDVVNYALNNTKTESNDIIVDIGANDCTMIGMFPKYLNRIAIEPAKNIDWKHVDESINIVNEFLSKEVILKETKGAILAHIIRSEEGAYQGSGEWHYHILDDQFVYVLQGWANLQFEDQGLVHVKAGTCFYQPSGINHAFLACSEDFEALEVCLPAEFETSSG